MNCFKPHASHLIKIIGVNIVLFVYFISPSFLTFMTLMFLLFITLLKNQNKLHQSLFPCKQECSLAKCINKNFQKYNNLTLIKRKQCSKVELVFLVVFKVTIDLLWLFPSWIIILLVSEIFASWELIKKFGITEKAKIHFDQMQISIQKVQAMIPRYYSSEIKGNYS